MSHIIAVVGMCGSGKSVLSDYLVQQGYAFLRFGQITLDIVKERGLTPTEENEKPIREEVRAKYGMGAYATLNIPKIDAMLKQGNVVIDGLYSWSEYKILKEKYADSFWVAAVFASPKLRYERLKNRTVIDEKMRNRPYIKAADAQVRDYNEIEKIEKGGPIAMADFTIVNNQGVDHLQESADSIIEAVANYA